MNPTATYSPEDNKLRLYPYGALTDSELSVVKAAGFRWAPKQELFVAPTWTPDREDVLLAMCEQIDDEDTSLVDRAESRAERFSEYSSNRAHDAESARRAVSAIADNIPFGQPILVGHHSEKRARKDAEKIESGMRRAIQMWDTAQYWQERAEGAVRSAKYKERPDVRARRIKGLEADLRKQERAVADATRALTMWDALDNDTQWTTKSGRLLTMHERALYIAGFDSIHKAFSLAEYPAAEGVHAYEGPQSLWSALDGGRITADQARGIAIECHHRGNAYRQRWISHYTNRIAYERAMQAEAGGTVADKSGPEVGGACRAWCSRAGAWSYIVKVNKVSVTLLDNWGNGGANFTRTIPFDKLTAVMSRAEVDAANAAGRTCETPCKTGFFLSAPTPEPTPEPTPDPTPDPTPEPSAADFQALRETLRAGVQVVSAPQLFPTPPALAERMVALARVRRGEVVLEPSAGTGRILDAIMNDDKAGGVVAVEINAVLADALRATYPLSSIHCADFLQFSRGNWPVDRIIMNPPFQNGVDILHIRHALTMLRPGGRLVAICANGPRQRAALMPLGGWEDLPPGTFAESGTQVNAAIIIIDKE